MDIEDIWQPFEQHVSRRTFLRNTALTAVGGLAAASCAPYPSGAGNSESLRFWNLFSGGDGLRMNQMESDFARSQPDIPVNSVTLTWGAPYYTKLAMAAVGGQPPDIAVMHLSRMLGYAPAGLLQPFDEAQLARYGITADRFLPEIWNNAYYQGKLYALPLDTHPFVMYYNTDICRKAGLLAADGKLVPLVGANAVMDAFQKVQKTTETLGLAVDTQDVNPWRIFYALYGQMGGKILTPDGSKLVLDDSKALQVLTFMADLTLKAKVASPTIDYGGAVALFASGKAGFFWQGEWEVTTFQTAKLPFSMTLFPNIFGNNTTQADSHTFVLPRQSVVDQQRLADSLKFISFMLKDSLVWAQGGHIPAYQPVVKSTAYQQMKPQANYAAQAKSVVYDPSAWFSGSGSQMETHAGSAFQAVMSGQLTPKQGLDQYRSYMQQMLATPSPV
ncbi:MAG: extracellular solute-binding protein [Ktedonobacteraceae bacterium]